MRRKIFALSLTLAATLGGLIPLATATRTAEAGPCNYRPKVGVYSCADCFGRGTSDTCSVSRSSCRAPAGCGNKFLPPWWGGGGGWDF